jgi:hypothetical protein
MNEEQKPFEYMELKAMCMLTAGYTALIFGTIDAGICDDEVKARKALEDQVDKLIKIRWDDPKKQSIKDE